MFELHAFFSQERFFGAATVWLTSADWDRVAYLLNSDSLYSDKFGPYILWDDLRLRARRRSIDLSGESIFES